MKNKRITLPRSAKYDGWRIVDPHCSFLGYCDEPKARWYLNKKLAEEVEPKTIRLNFEPKVSQSCLPRKDIPRETKCVVCGAEKDILTRHHAIPKIYREAMTEKYKKNKSKDVVLLCQKCHSLYEESAAELKGKIAKRYGVPVYSAGPLACAFMVSHNLKKHGRGMPKEKRDHFRKKLQTMLDKDPMAEDFLRSLPKRLSNKSTMKIKQKLCREGNYHGKSVIRTYLLKSASISCRITRLTVSRRWIVNVGVGVKFEEKMMMNGQPDEGRDTQVQPRGPSVVEKVGAAITKAIINPAAAHRIEVQI